jgi:hypothetical protein
MLLPAAAFARFPLSSFTVFRSHHPTFEQLQSIDCIAALSLPHLLLLLSLHYMT